MFVCIQSAEEKLETDEIGENPSDTSGDPMDFKTNVHLFTAVSFLACANYGLQQAVNDNEELQA